MNRSAKSLHQDCHKVTMTREPHFVGVGGREVGSPLPAMVQVKGSLTSSLSWIRKRGSKCSMVLQQKQSRAKGSQVNTDTAKGSQVNTDTAKGSQVNTDTAKGSQVNTDTAKGSQVNTDTSGVQCTPQGNTNTAATLTHQQSKGFTGQH